MSSSFTKFWKIIQDETEPDSCDMEKRPVQNLRMKGPLDINGLKFERIFFFFFRIENK